MADESEDKPWSETGPFEKIWIVVVSWILERIDNRKKRSIAGSVTDRRAHAS